MLSSSGNRRRHPERARYFGFGGDAGGSFEFGAMAGSFVSSLAPCSGVRMASLAGSTTSGQRILEDYTAVRHVMIKL